jgi:hypothetical protein
LARPGVPERSVTYRSALRNSISAASAARLAPVQKVLTQDHGSPAGLDNHRDPVTTSYHPGGEPGHTLIDTQMEITMTTETGALVRRAYHFAEGDVPDAQLGVLPDFTSAVAAPAPAR